MVATLMGCPSEPDCKDIGRLARVGDLILLSPLQASYNQGDIITFKIDVPANNNYFYNGEETNIFDLTNAFEGNLRTSYTQIFSGNQLEFIAGNKGSEENTFNLEYNTTSQTYELEFKITLNKPGNYFISTDDFVKFQGSGECNFFRLETNILRNDPGPGIIEFTVQ